MKVENLFRIIDSEFYTGVPDSLLRSLCDFLMDKYGIDPQHHVIAANEGNCAALAAGYYLATGKVPVVYMQNSGEGNMINPAASLLNSKVYAIPVVFIIGWRGQPGINDEPQHIFQGEITIRLLEDLGIKTFVINRDTTDEDVMLIMQEYRKELALGKDVAFVISKGALYYDKCVYYTNDNIMDREEIIRHVVAASGENPVVSTTGKASRELFEIRTANVQEHKYDFLTVGSMGHASSIALGIAIHKPMAKVWCIDGDGAVLMHMGAMAVIGASAPKNFVHIVINNGAHETVGGMPTAVSKINLTDIAKACGYLHVACVHDFSDLDKELEMAKTMDKLCFIEVKSSIAARSDLGRPTVTPLQNRQRFMDYLSCLR
ncbi:MAG: phosphonopyruvate decarboxylase [Blautia sp.]|nr:phosphonopyruvate decarboxylase [Blautia sp.]